MHLTRMTSATITRRDETTTLLVAARPTPAAPWLVVYQKIRRDRPDDESKDGRLKRGCYEIGPLEIVEGTPDVKIEGHSGRREFRQVAAEQAREIHKQRQQWQRYDAGDHSRDHKKLEGVDRQGLDSIDLLSHPHIGEHGADP